MGTYATNAQVGARIPGRAPTASSVPSTAQVDAWIDEAEAMLTGVLIAASIPTPITGSGATIMRSWVCDFGEGMTRVAHASASGDAGNLDGEAQLERFYKTIEAIIASPATYGAMLCGGTITGASRVRGYVLANDDGLSISNGDFDPEFTGDEEF